MITFTIILISMLTIIHMINLSLSYVFDGLKKKEKGDA
jgi:hypothetical protein